MPFKTATKVMKILNYNTAQAFAQPSVQGWLVVFVCGFLAVCLIGLLPCIAVWLIVKVLRRLPEPPLPDWDVTVLSTASIVLQVASVFGALLATVMVLDLMRRRRQTVRVPGHHPIIGDYEHSVFYKTWHAEPVLPTGKPVRLSASGSGPSETQAALWQQFTTRYEELLASATRSLLAEGHPLAGCESLTLAPNAITLTQDGQMHLSFEFATVPENFWESEADQPYPTAIFTPALELMRTEWLKPYG
ncbi:hypothetical protein [Prosthecobacter sp.]|uniref:hypothetical protein n=1 Tax=Prosthecobacter sp. TaxID=1965333 RepID=UPI0037837F7C